MHKVTALVFLLLVIASHADAQPKKIRKGGRRNKAESEFAVKKNDFQAEWEFGHEILNDQLGVVTYPNVELHYGLSDRLEVNTEMSLLTATDKSVTPHNTVTGIEPVLLGANYLLLRDTEKRPSIIVSAQLAVPFLATKKLIAYHLAPTVQVSVQQAVHKDMVFGLSSGLFWDGYSTTPQYIYNADASYTFIKKWMLTGECFGFVNHEPPQNNLDASLAYVINDYIQFGFTAGMGISAAAHKSYFAVNGTWGLNTAKRKNKN